MTWKQIRRIVVVAAAFTAAPLSAQSITNGSMSGSCAGGVLPTGWSNFGTGIPDIVDPTCNLGVVGGAFAAPASASPDGGTWVGLAKDPFPPAVATERFGQIVSGFTIGQRYRISWYASNFGYNDFGAGFTNPNQIEVTSNGVVSLGMGSLVSLGSGWVAQSIEFIATDLSKTLIFQLGANNTSYMGIDGIALNRVSEVPEPATATLLGVGLTALVLARRRKRSA